MALCTKIPAALDLHLKSLVNLPPVKWLNCDNLKNPKDLYLEPFVLPAEPMQANVGKDSLNWHFGIYQVSVYSPPGKGSGICNSMCDSIIDLFKKGTIIIYDDVSISITKSYAGPFMMDTEWIHRPVSINYKLLSNN